MPRTEYQHQLASLRADVVAMADLVLERYEEALAALETKDESRARNVIDSDAAINETYLELESDCIELFALQQPVAGDLRFIASSFKILTDLERIGDLAVNLAEYALDAQQDRHPEVDVMYIGSETGALVSEAMTAYEQGDTKTALAVADRDDHIDGLCEQAGAAVVEELLRTRYDENESVINDVTRLLLTIRDLERVGDHAVNICARTVYMIEHDDELIY